VMIPVEDVKKGSAPRTAGIGCRAVAWAKKVLQSKSGWAIDILLFPSLSCK
jgi:hypothetical protein